jgi:hypothetical protein
MRAFSLSAALASLLVIVTGPTRAAVRYPLTLSLDAQFKSGATTISTTVTMQVNRAMADSARTKVTQALDYGGYAKFYDALRPQPVLGTIRTQSSSVEIRYTREDGSRLVLVSDRPLFFVSQNSSKPKAGFELTVVELTINPDGTITGQMAGAARVRPAPGGPGAGVLLDTYAEELVQLKGKVGP